MNYLPAQVEDVDTAGGFICGAKFWFQQFDSATLELGTAYFDSLDTVDE
jgi:hypothetical protein